MAGFEIAREDSVQESIQKLIESLNRIGTTEDGDGSETSGTMMAKLNKILENLGLGFSVVKSIQTQYLTNMNLTSAGGSYLYYATFNISPVNPEKSIVLINGTNGEGSAGVYSFFLYSISSNQVKVGTNSQNDRYIFRSVGIQVVEFF